MAKKNEKKWLVPAIIVAVLIIVIGGLIWSQSKPKGSGKTIKIGLITDIGGAASYYGGSTAIGASLAQKDLAKEGYSVEIIYEDSQLDPAKALTSAKKLVEIDHVDGIYMELNPLVYSVTPYIKSLGEDKVPLVVFGSAANSPLKELPYAFKTYFNYTKACSQLAQVYKDQGVKKIGMLKVNMEFGDVCNEAVKTVYGDNAITEAYDTGEKDFNTQILKLKQAGVGAIINPSWESDNLTALKGMKENNFVVPYGTAFDSVGVDSQKAYPDMLSDITVFGLKDIDTDVLAKLKTEAGSKDLSTPYAGAQAYLHIKQMAKSIDGSNGDIKTEFAKMKKTPAESLLGFGGFDENRESIFKLEFGPVKAIQ